MDTLTLTIAILSLIGNMLWVFLFIFHKQTKEKVVCEILAPISKQIAHYIFLEQLNASKLESERRSLIARVNTGDPEAIAEMIRQSEGRQ